MTTIVVGGHSRNVGKTAVAAALIAELWEYRWTAIKISPHRHGHPTEDCEDWGEQPYELSEERDRTGRSDTARFLAAGASRSVWLRVKPDRWEFSMQQLLPTLISDPHVIIESNNILKFIQPDLCIAVLRFDIPDFKDSARELLKRAHAAVVVCSCSSEPAWGGLARSEWSHLPLFPTTDPGSIPGGLLELARQCLRSTGC